MLSFVWAVVVPWSCEGFHRRTRLADRGSGDCFNDLNNLLAGVGVHLALATGHGNVDETAGVKNTLVGATLRVLLLLLGLDLRSGSLDLTGTGERAVNLTHVG